jgi:hypothetical protein
MMDLHELLFHCLRHFVHLDHSNAAIHTAPVRYSPITFRLAELLLRSFPAATESTGDALDDVIVRQVFDHIRQYEEDTGRP